MSEGRHPLDVTTGVTRLSDSISRPLERLFQTGGLVLVFVFVGFTSMVLAYAFTTDYSPWLFGAGTTIVFACLCLFLYGQVAGPQKARRLIRENSELIDSVQAMAIELTKSLGDMQSLLFQHNQQVRKIVELAMPLLSEIPQFKNLEISDSEAIDRLILTSTEKSSQIIADLRRALETCDARPLAGYKNDLVAMRNALHEALAKRERIAARFSQYKGTLDDFGAQFVAFSECIDALNDRVATYLTAANQGIQIVVGFPGVSALAGSLGLSTLEKKASGLAEAIRVARETNGHLRAAVESRDAKRLAACVEGVKTLRAKVATLPPAASPEPSA